MKKFSKNVIILLFFSIPASILNYVFSLAVGRLLTVEQFGVYNSMNSLASNIIAVYAPFAILVTRITAEEIDCPGKNENRYKQITWIYVAFFVVTSIVGMIAYPFLDGKFGATSFIQWLFILIMIGVMGLHSIANSAVQGLQRFILYGVMSVLVILLKLIFTVGGIQTGNGFGSVIFALIVSHAVIIVMCTVIMKKACRVIDGERDATVYPQYSVKEIGTLYGLTFLVQLIYAFYLNGGEIVFMNFLCDETEIGLYSSIIMLAKIAVFLITTFNSALLPAIASKAADIKSAKGMLYASLAFSFVCSIAFVLVLLICGDWLVPLLWGDKYTPGLKYLGAALMYAMPLANLLVVHTYILGRGKLKFYSICLSLTLIASAIVGVALSANTAAVPMSFGVGMCVCIVVSMIYIIIGDKEDEGKQTDNNNDIM